MDIIFKGRRTDVQERFRDYASAKLGKVEKLDRKAMRVDVEVSAERNPRQSGQRERVELTIASRGPVVRAEAAADDRFAAFDRALAKLEMRLRRVGERRKGRRLAHLAGRAADAARATGSALPGQAAGAGSSAEPEFAQPGPVLAQDEAPLAGGTADAGAESEGGEGGPPDGQPAGYGVPIQMEGDGPVVVREKFHPAAPMSVDQALLEMELVGHDFYLFQDESCGHPSVVYRRRGYSYGLIRLVPAPGAGA